MFDFLGLCKHLGYFGDPPGALADYHGEIRKQGVPSGPPSCRRRPRRRSQSPGMVQQVGRSCARRQIAERDTRGLAQGGHACWVVVFSASRCPGLHFPGSFRGVLPGIQGCPMHSRSPATAACCLPTSPFCTRVGQTHYVPLTKINADEEQAEHVLRLQNASRSRVIWKPLPAWLAAEFATLPAAKSARLSQNSTNVAERGSAIDGVGRNCACSCALLVYCPIDFTPFVVGWLIVSSSRRPKHSRNHAPSEKCS